MWQKKWIFGNWKMNGRSRQNLDFLRALTVAGLPEDVCVGIAAPFPYLMQIADLLRACEILPGAQDCSRFAEDGAFTGEVSAAMIADCAARFVLIGHSERRSAFGEDNEILTAKMRNAAAAGLIPVLCVGETAEQRARGCEREVIAEQLRPIAGIESTGIALAYEPVWAIGTGKMPSDEQIADMNAFIRECVLSMKTEDVTIRVLYGGSVNADNARTVLTVAQADGALVGGASLRVDSFRRIIAAATK